MMDNKIEFGTCQLTPLEELPFQWISLINSAAAIAKNGNVGQLASLTWRLADALHLLRDFAEAHEVTDLPGIHLPTGRGAMLQGLNDGK